MRIKDKEDGLLRKELDHNRLLGHGLLACGHSLLPRTEGTKEQLLQTRKWKKKAIIKACIGKVRGRKTRR